MAFPNITQWGDLSSKKSDWQLVRDFFFWMKTRDDVDIVNC
jgi:hypothetical protein